MSDPSTEKVFYPAVPGRGLTVPAVPLEWGSRAAGRDVALALSAFVTVADRAVSHLDAIPAGGVRAAAEPMAREMVARPSPVAAFDHQVTDAVASR
ncbi:hypothetical protein [Micromonospora sp. NPDC049274]|uniref:hypothetical protein n=1 Tax=Micromonospora sp. NPDC049274 TaxID=3154829 RepID=UPI0034299991